MPSFPHSSVAQVIKSFFRKHGPVYRFEPTRSKPSLHSHRKIFFDRDEKQSFKTTKDIRIIFNNIVFPISSL